MANFIECYEVTETASLNYMIILRSYLSIILRRPPPGNHNPMSPVCSQPSSSITSLLFKVFKKVGWSQYSQIHKTRTNMRKVNTYAHDPYGSLGKQSGPWHKFLHEGRADPQRYNSFLEHPQALSLLHNYTNSVLRQTNRNLIVSKHLLLKSFLR